MSILSTADLLGRENKFRLQNSSNSLDLDPLSAYTRKPAVFRYLTQEFIDRLGPPGPITIPKYEPFKSMKAAENIHNGNKNNQVNNSGKTGKLNSINGNHKDSIDHIDLSKINLNGNQKNHALNYKNINSFEESNRKSQHNNEKKLSDKNTEVRSNGDMIHDGHWFTLKLHETCNEIVKKVKIVDDFIKNENNLMDEEVTGILRCFIGKANLLLEQKLQQFRQLCEKNIASNSKDEFATTNEDLEGFWAMVYLQVDDISKSFEEILQLKNNKWKRPEPINKVKSGAKLKNGKVPSPHKYSPKSSPANDEARRNRLREAKQRQQQSLNDSNNSDDVTIFISQTCKNEP